MLFLSVGGLFSAKNVLFLSSYTNLDWAWVVTRPQAPTPPLTVHTFEAAVNACGLMLRSHYPDHEWLGVYWSCSMLPGILCLWKRVY